MDDWSKQIFDAFDDAVQEFAQQLSRDTERWLEDLTEQLASTSESWANATDEWAEQVQDAIEPEVDRMVDELNRVVGPLTIVIDRRVDDVAEQLTLFLEPLLLPNVSMLDRWLEDVSAPINCTVEPLLQNYPACVGCRNFYGQAHGGNMLVCAMHPFGPDETQHCADWESVY